MIDAVERTAESLAPTIDTVRSALPSQQYRLEAGRDERDVIGEAVSALWTLRRQFPLPTWRAGRRRNGRRAERGG